MVVNRNSFALQEAEYALERESEFLKNVKIVQKKAKSSQDNIEGRIKWQQQWSDIVTSISRLQIDDSEIRKIVDSTASDDRGDETDVQTSRNQAFIGIVTELQNMILHDQVSKETAILQYRKLHNMISNICDSLYVEIIDSEYNFNALQYIIKATTQYIDTHIDDVTIKICRSTINGNTVETLQEFSHVHRTSYIITKKLQEKNDINKQLLQTYQTLPSQSDASGNCSSNKSAFTKQNGFKSAFKHENQCSKNFFLAGNEMHCQTETDKDSTTDERTNKIVQYLQYDDIMKQLKMCEIYIRNYYFAANYIDVETEISVYDTLLTKLLLALAEAATKFCCASECPDEKKIYFWHLLGIKLTQMYLTPLQNIYDNIFLYTLEYIDEAANTAAECTSENTIIDSAGNYVTVETVNSYANSMLKNMRKQKIFVLLTCMEYVSKVIALGNEELNNILSDLKKEIVQESRKINYLEEKSKHNERIEQVAQLTKEVQQQEQQALAAKKWYFAERQRQNEEKLEKWRAEKEQQSQTEDEEKITKREIDREKKIREHEKNLINVQKRAVINEEKKKMENSKLAAIKQAQEDKQNKQQEAILKLKNKVSTYKSNYKGHTSAYLSLLKSTSEFLEELKDGSRGEGDAGTFGYTDKDIYKDIRKILTDRLLSIGVNIGSNNYALHMIQSQNPCKSVKRDLNVSVLKNYY